MQKCLKNAINRLINLPKYEEVKKYHNFDITSIHNGYFSQDKKGALKDTKGDTQADYDTYNTIMKDKEWLLSYDCPLRFIFSHSALKEGWDNPNVFQVCTLIEQKSVFTQRQKIGRGLRLCVNQDGDRIEDKNINVLHVIANESFAEFSEKLQKELEDETGTKFGIVQLSLFSGMKYEEEIIKTKTVSEEKADSIVGFMVENGLLNADLKPNDNAKETFQSIVVPDELENVAHVVSYALETGETVSKSQIIGQNYEEKTVIEKEITHTEATEIIEHFKAKDYISKIGKMKDSMSNALISNTLDLPKKFESIKIEISSKLAQVDNKLPIRNEQSEVKVKLKKQVLMSQEFIEIWNKIKQKTTYRVEFNTDELIEKCVQDLKSMDKIPKTKLLMSSASINVENAGVSHTECGFKVQELETTYDELPNVISIISEQTLIKRSTVREILLKSNRCEDFLINPQAFLEKALGIIMFNRHNLAIDGIKYIKLDGQENFAMEVFDDEELTANLERNAVEVHNSIYNYVIYDSLTVEKPFAMALDEDPDVKMFFKIPPQFKIETPIGTYNPDWAVYMDTDGVEKLYFVVETKGSNEVRDLRTPEQLKIHCGQRHFESLANDISMKVTKKWKDLKISL